MSVVATRLVFLAFLGLTGFITYNALYLQEQRNGALFPTAGAPRVPLPDGPIHVGNPPASAPKPATVATDLPPLRGQAAPETDGREGLHSLEILVATYLSARDGRKVALPLEY